MTFGEQFDVRCADLTLHGWFPVEIVGSFYGIYNDALQMGFWVDRVGQDYPKVKRLAVYNRRVEWAEMPESQLDLIEQRLRQT